MPINPLNLIQSMVAAGTAAAKGYAGDLRNYLETRAKLMADGLVLLAADRAADKVTDGDVQFALQQIKESEATALLALDVTLRAAAQDAINAALAVAGNAINEAVGFAIL